MRVFILCGGRGTRLEDYSYPKPLNMIHGLPSITYCLQNVPATVALHFIVAPHLAEYNFEEIVRNQFKDRVCVFTTIPYFTRGPVESVSLLFEISRLHGYLRLNSEQWYTKYRCDNRKYCESCPPRCRDAHDKGSNKSLTFVLRLFKNHTVYRRRLKLGQ